MGSNTLVRLASSNVSDVTPSYVGSPSAYPSAYPRREFLLNDGIPWRQVLRIVREHWKISLGFVLVLEIALAALAFSLDNTYESRATIEVEPPSAGPMASDSILPATPAQQNYIETQIEILQGDNLALGVIQELGLSDDSEFLKQSWIEKLPGQVISWLKRKQSSGPPQTESMLQRYRGHLTVAQVKGSRLVEIRYESYDPRLSADVVKTAVRQFMEMTHRSKYEATLRAAQSLAPEMSELKASVERSSRALLDFQRTHEGVELGSAGAAGTNGSAGTALGNPVSVRVAQLNQQLTEAINERLQEEAYMKLLAQGSNSDALPQMKDDPVIQELTTRVVDSRAQLAQAHAVYGANNPQVRKLQLQVEELTSQLEAERSRVANRLKATYSSAVQREELIRKTLRDLKGTLDTSNANSVRYDALKREADANSNLYTALSSRIKELAMSGSLNANNIRLLDEARVPERPSGPRRVRILVFGLLFGLFGGVALAFIAEGMDDTISSLDDLRDWSRLPALALVPRISGEHNHRGRLSSRTFPASLPPALSMTPRGVRVFAEAHNSPEKESIRNLSTAIRLSFLPDQRSVNTVLITSAFPREGKTTVAVNLAVALAQHGRTCLVDADIRHPAITSSFGLSRRPGLQDLLVDSRNLREICAPLGERSALAVLGVGSRRSDALELLMSQRMRNLVQELKQVFEYIVLDSAPIIPFSDARWLATLSDGSIFVARSSTTTRRAMMWGTEMLEKSHAPVLGIVLNDVDLQSEYYSYGADRYSYP